MRFRRIVKGKFMRLAAFILEDMDHILQVWDEFAATQLPAARSMNAVTLRDHARQLLLAIVKDLGEAQSRQAQSEKSMGRAPRLLDAPETAAETHGFLRAQSGFEINQMAAEYRALRASVLRRWADKCGPAPGDQEDMIRFNEAIDQALAESVAHFAAKVNEARNLFLGMLGHDMRTPLQAIQLTATYLGALNAGDKISQAAGRLIRSGAQMQRLLDDLVEYNRSHLGMGMPLAPVEVDIVSLFKAELEQIATAHPGHAVELEVAGDTHGSWDALALQRLLGNLVENAIKYGTKGQPIRVAVHGAGEDLQFEVRNSGDPLEQSVLDRMFEPLRRGQGRGLGYGPDAGGPSEGGLGLGLYISREIAKAHGGRIDAISRNGEVTFSVTLPRQQLLRP